jgi:hypothetical protein
MFFSDTFANYLGLPLPSCEPLASGFIGTDARPMDPFGNSLAAAQRVPGRDFSIAHNTVQRTLNDFMLTAGLQTVLEAENFFRGKVSAEHHDAYIEHFMRDSDSRRHGIIPDILVHNYPATREDVATMQTASGRTKPAIFEVKGLRYTRNTYPVTLRGTDSRARRVPLEYKQKAHAIDATIAPTTTRPLGDENGPSGPFEKALRSFATGGPIPIVFGAFGEVNKGCDKVINMLAKLAAKTTFGKSLAPCRSASKLGAETLLRIQFRRVLGVQIAKANARLKLQRLHLVGSTPDEARNLSRQQRHSRHWNPDTDCSSRFSANYNRNSNYQAWFEFRQSTRHFSDTL